MCWVLPQVALPHDDELEGSSLVSPSALATKSQTARQYGTSTVPGAREDPGLYVREIQPSHRHHLYEYGTPNHADYNYRTSTVIRTSTDNRSESDFEFESEALTVTPLMPAPRSAHCQAGVKRA
eukprot:scaffold440940_cov28-Prasinocladus_malaysianus.AAC.1